VGGTVHRQLDRDFYWSQFVARNFSNVRDTGTCQASGLGAKDTCYSMLQRSAPGVCPTSSCSIICFEGIPEINFYSVFAKIDRASGDAVLRAICLSRKTPGPTVCVNWDTGEIINPHVVGQSRGIAFDYEFTPWGSSSRTSLGRRAPGYVAFDVLFADGEDVRAAPLKERKAMLTSIVRRYKMQHSKPVLGEGKAAFKAVCDFDLEGIVAKPAR
jgi:hypothetical protein